MNLLTIVLLTNLVTLAFSDAYYPPNFFLKGPTSQATIYGVDGSKILSVADAGSISSDGIKGPTVSSYSSSQNLAASSGPGVVLQGPSMSATIIGPSGSVSTADAEGNQNSNYNGHFGSKSIGTPTDGSAGYNIAQPSLPSVNIKGPSAWGMNVGPSFVSHSNIDGNNKGNQVYGTNRPRPCSSTSNDCGVNSFGPTHSSGVKKSGDVDDSTGLPSAPTVNIQGPSAWGMNIGSSFTSQGIYGGSNKENQQPSQTKTEPCNSTSKDCGVNSLDATDSSGTQKSGDRVDNTVLPSAPNVYIQGPSAWGTNLGPTFTSHGHFGGSNKENQQPSQTKAEPCNSTSNGCGVNSFGVTHSSGTQKSSEADDNTVSPSAPSVNIQGPSAWGSNIGPTFTSHGHFTGRNNRNHQQPSQTKAEPCNSTSESCGVHPFGATHSSGTQKSGDGGHNTALPSAPSVNIQGPSSWGTNIGPSFASHGIFGGSNKANQQSSQTKTEPCKSTSKGYDINPYGATNSDGIQKSGDTGHSTALPSAPSVNIKRPSAWGTNIGPSYTSHNNFDGNNAQNQQHTASVAGPCSSNSKSCEVNAFGAIHTSERPSVGSAGKNSELPSVPTVNIQGSTARGKNVGARYSNLGGSSKGNQESATYSGIQNGQSINVHSFPSPSYGSSQNNQNLNNQKASATFSKSCDQFPKNCKPNARDLNTGSNANIQDPSAASLTIGLNRNGGTGTNIASSSNKNSYGSVEKASVDNPSTPSPISTSSSYSGLFGHLNAHDQVPINHGAASFSSSTSNTYTYTKPLIKDSSNDFGQNDKYYSSGQKVLSNPIWQGHRTFTSSSIQGSHNLGHNGGNGESFTSSSYNSPVYNKPSHGISSSWFASKAINGANNNIVIPESNIGFDKQNKGYGTLKYHNSESSSLAPPTYVMPDGVNHEQQNPFGSVKNGKSIKDPKYDCYVIELPSDPYAYELSPGEYSVLLKKIAHHHYHKHPH